MAPAIAIVGAGPSGLALASILERKGLDYIIYERSRREVAPGGGYLDLHPGSGQRAMREAGVFEEFQKHSRTGDATIHLLYNHYDEKVSEFGRGRDAPEIDRWAIRNDLLTRIPEDENDRVVLAFTDGTTATGFKLVIGADGSYSKIRPLADKLYITTKILPGNPFYSQMEAIAGKGAMIVVGKGVHMFNSRQGDGHYRVDIGLQRRERRPSNSTKVSLGR